MGEDIVEALQLMSDEELQQLLQAGNAPNRSAFLERELTRAGQVPGMQDYSSMGGSMFGGLANMLRQGMGGAQQKDARAGIADQSKLLEDPAIMRTVLGGSPPPGQQPAPAAAPSAPKSKQQILIELLRKSGGAPDMAGEMKLGLAS